MEAWLQRTRMGWIQDHTLLAIREEALKVGVGKRGFRGGGGRGGCRR
jgi:hypothetical protein